MKLVTFSARDGAARVGVVDSQAGIVRDASPVLGEAGVLDVIRDWETRGPQLAQSLADLASLPLDEVKLHAPIPVPARDIFAVGKNYSEHVKEFGRSGYDQPDKSEDLPTDPVVFPKATTAVTGPYDDIESHPGVTDELDYEVELGVIIGKGGRGISRENAYDHVWGYVLIDDFTARDLQKKHKQWLIGKSLDTFCPMGPYAVSADEIPDVTALEVRSKVNGEDRQYGKVADLIFDIPELIAVLSAGITLQPGDIIATGTPAGVGIGFDPPKFVHPGDVIEMTITGLGTQRNTVV
ncbi:fumarylacetoacetate hydrolase family protein [Granulicoccus phenolivorans]|uniref:fumarylacetoacetate hydrolase family protein n=1 Tax=Granulicoccus phenolivorans TaxID=266854 RepID=UPI00040D7EB3|nr:fumarylacetoacetate hydrolase family protein [Granulicoccus phenolivorans]